MLMPTPLIQILLLIALLTLGYTFFIAWSVKRLPTGTDKMREIADAIREGAMAFLKRQYKILAVFVLAMTIVLYFAIGWQTAFAFVFGALLSAIAGNIGMRIATHATNTANPVAATRSTSRSTSRRWPRRRTSSSELCRRPGSPGRSRPWARSPRS